MRKLFIILLALCIFVNLIRSTSIEQPSEDETGKDLEEENNFDERTFNETESPTETPTEPPTTAPTTPPVIYGPKEIFDFTLWNLCIQWSIENNNSLAYTAANGNGRRQNTNTYACSPIIDFNGAFVFSFSFTATTIRGSAVLEVSFASDSSQFNPIETFLIGNSNPITSYEFAFLATFPSTVDTSFILRVAAATPDALFTLSNFQLTPSPKSVPAPTCTNYLGFQVYQIEKLLTCLSSNQLSEKIRKSSVNLIKLKERVINSRNLAYDLPLGKWIDIFNSFKNGNACEFNFQDFDTWTWLFNYQVSSVIQSVDDQPLQRRKLR